MSSRRTRDGSTGGADGRLWLRSLSGRPLPSYPGLDLGADLRDRARGLRDVAREHLYRFLADRRYPSPSPR